MHVARWRRKAKGGYHIYESEEDALHKTNGVYEATAADGDNTTTATTNNADEDDDEQDDNADDNQDNDDEDGNAERERLGRPEMFSQGALLDPLTAPTRVLECKRIDLVAKDATSTTHSNA